MSWVWCAALRVKQVIVVLFMVIIPAIRTGRRFIDNPAVILKHETLDKHIFQHSPKAWFNFVKAFIFHNLLRFYLSTKHTDEGLLQFWGSQHDRSVLLKAIMKETLNNTQKNSHKYGKNIFNRPTWCFSCSKNTVGDKCDLVEFHLRAVFQLNITINTLLTPACCSGDFATKSQIWIFSLLNYLMSFCGTYSNVNVYPKGQVIHLFSAGNQILIDITFTVMDSNRIAVHKIENPLDNVKIEWFLVISVHNIKLSELYVSVPKFQTVELNVSSTIDVVSVEVFDGPSALFPQLNASAPGCLKASSFQCTVHTYLNNSVKITDYLQTEVTYRGVLQSNQNAMWISHQGQINATLKTTKIVTLGTENGFQFNITITEVNFVNFEMPLCRSAGLTVYDNITNTYSERFTLCGTESLFQPSYQYKNMYSTQNYVVIVFYTHVRINNNISITLSQTHCRLHKVDACKYTTARIFSPCDGFTHHGMFAELPEKETVSLRESTCVVIQLHHNHSTRSCVILLGPEINSSK